jgi:hypothetical protein
VTPKESDRIARSLQRVLQDAGEDLRLFVCACGYVAFRIGHHADLADNGAGWQVAPHAGCHGCGNVPPCPACGRPAVPVWDPIRSMTAQEPSR